MSDSTTDPKALDLEEDESLREHLDEPVETSSLSEDSKDEKPTVDAYESARKAVGESSSDSEKDSRGAEAEAEAGKEKPASVEDEPLPDDVSAEELDGYKPKTRRRIEQLLAQGKEKDKQLEALQGPAEEYGKIEEFMRAHELVPEAVAEALQVTALLRDDPEKALEMLTPIFRNLAVRTGHVLPDDLRQDVQDGRLTTERAIEIARARARNQHLESRTTRIEQKLEDSGRSRLAAEMDSAVRDWESRISSSDPDYSRKQALVSRSIQAELAARARTGQLPRTREEAVSLVETVYGEVNKALQDLIPKKPEITPLEGGGSKSARAAPRNKYEAAMAALQS